MLDPSVNDTIWQQPSRLGIQVPITPPRKDATNGLTTEIDDRSEDLVILSVQEAETLTSTPPKKTWQEQQCCNLGIKAAITPCKYAGCGAQMRTDESPTAAVQIKLDENCFFCSISVVLTGSQESHRVCRPCDGMGSGQRLQRSWHWHLNCTDTPVAIFAPLGPKHAWQIYNSLGSTSRLEFTIYLVNHREHFEVLSSVS